MKLIPIISLSMALGSLTYTGYSAWNLRRLEATWESIDQMAPPIGEAKADTVWQSLCHDPEGSTGTRIRFVPCDSVVVRIKEPEFRI